MTVTETNAREAHIQEVFDLCKNWGRWGADDEKGTLNLITESKVARLGRLVSFGRHVACSAPLPTRPNAENHMPAGHHMLIAGDAARATGVPGLEVTADFISLAMHGMACTHLDALCHLGTDGLTYNGVPISEVKSTGAARNSVMAARNGIVTRGVLLDIPHMRKQPWLEPGEVITAEELLETAGLEGVTVEEGDAILIGTGRDARRSAKGPWDPVAVGLPGIAPEAALLFHEWDVAMLGTDVVLDPHPGPGYGKWPMPLHQISLVAMGMPIIDNLSLAALSLACAELERWEFGIVIAPLVIEGGTGSPVNPIAIF